MYEYGMPGAETGRNPVMQNVLYKGRHSDGKEQRKFHRITRNSALKSPQGNFLGFRNMNGQVYRIKKPSQYLADLITDSVGWRKSGSVTSF